MEAGAAPDAAVHTALFLGPLAASGLPVPWPALVVGLVRSAAGSTRAEEVGVTFDGGFADGHDAGAEGTGGPGGSMPQGVG